MAGFDRIDINKKRSIPAGIKLILLILVILGFWLKGCWQRKEKDYYVISEAKVRDFTSQSIDVEFIVENHTNMEVKKNIIIEVYAPNRSKIASRITEIEISPSSKKKYLKVLQKLERPIKRVEDIGKVNVELYNPKIF